MSTFIKWLEELSEKDTKVRAVLRRSLAFAPGAFPAAYPFVEPFVSDEDGRWRREMFYLVAGLWAAHWRKDRGGQPQPLGKACAEQQRKSPGTERRFIALLDADADELPHRLRQMAALLKDFTLDFEALLTGLIYWNHQSKRTQNQWARDFYRNVNPEKETSTAAEKDEKP